MLKLYHAFDGMDTTDWRFSISGEDYRELLDLCFCKASHVSFSRGNWRLPADKSFEKALEPHLIKDFYVRRWFCYEISNRPINTLLYPATKEVKNIILSYMHDIFGLYSKGGGPQEWSQSVEDICIFADDKVLIGTVMHELICISYPPDKDFTEKILPLGCWKVIDGDINQFSLSDHIESD